MSDLKEIAASVNRLAVPGMKPKALIAAVRERHPEASKKAVVRAAFYAVIEQAERDPERARLLQAYALEGRGEDEEENPARMKRRPRGPKAS